MSWDSDSLAFYLLSDAKQNNNLKIIVFILVW